MPLDKNTISEMINNVPNNIIPSTGGDSKKQGEVAVDFEGFKTMWQSGPKKKKRGEDYGF